MSAVSFVILGEPASKANSRKIVSFGGRPAKHVFHWVDRNNPRVEIEIDSIDGNGVLL